MINLCVNDETSSLKSVVLGIAECLGSTPRIEEAYDPKSKQHILAGTFPKEEDLLLELAALERILDKYQVRIYRPEELADTNQIFARDIGFVIGNKFVVPNILKDREHEQEGINFLLSQFSINQILRMPAVARAEGGDVMPWGNKVFVGYSEQEDFKKYRVSRTNRGGLEFLKKSFPEHQVIGFELNKSDDDPKENALHLDCCFQPIGKGQCIIYPGGFKHEKDYQFLTDLFGKENCIHISKQEMYDMNSNVFSVSPQVVISEKGFDRLNNKLENRGFTVETVPYTEAAKMEGLLRCSTLPLDREY